MPNGFVNQNGDSYSANYAYGTGVVEVILGSSTLTSQLRFACTFKVVMIDGTPILSKINLQDYNEVKQVFHLPD